MSSPAPASVSSMTGEPGPSLPVLDDWLNAKAITRHPALRVVDMDNHSGLRVISEHDIPIGTVLCSVPKSSILSHRTTSLTSLPFALDQASPAEVVLHLAACLLHELRLGRESTFYGYLQILPRRTVLLPTFWEDEDLAGPDGPSALALLRGTEGERELRRKEAEGLALRYYSTVAPLLPATSDHPSPSPFSTFAHAYSLVSSRAFVIDAYHTVGLVPFCDLLNHSARAHTSLLSDEFVCPACGSLLACGHDETAMEEADLERAMEDAAIGGSATSAASGLETGAAKRSGPGSVTRRGVPPRLAHLPERYLLRLEQEGNTVDIRAERAIEAGEEVFSAYDDSAGDGKLLVEWGFVGRESGGNGIIWPPRELLDETTLRIFVAVLQPGRREGAIGEEGTSMIAPGDPNHLGLLNLNSDGRISKYLFVAIYLREGLAVEQDLGLVEAGLVALVHDLASPNPAAESCKLARAIVRLLDKRLAVLHGDDGSWAELQSAYDEATPLIRLSLALVIDETTLLEGARDRWEAIVQGSERTPL